MKGRVFALLTAVGLLLPCALRAQTAFDAHRFCVRVHTMLPQQYRSRVLTSPYDLCIHADSVRLHLPYMGRVYRPVPGNDGLDFDTPVTDYKVTPRRKGATRITFGTRHRMVGYDITLDITATGRVSVTLRPDNAQLVRYDGELMTCEK